MFQTVATILKTEDLRNRIFFTLAMLAIYRLGIFIPAPGVDRNALSDFFADTQGTLLSLYNMFSGGALEQFSVFVLGIMPYISASIIMQFGQVMIPRVERLKSEGQAGRKKINQYTTENRLSENRNVRKIKKTKSKKKQQEEASSKKKKQEAARRRSKKKQAARRSKKQQEDNG